MPTIQSIPLPFPSNGPPPGFDYEGRSMSPSQSSDESAAIALLHGGVNERDTWNGERKCVVCGRGKERGLRFCQIIPEFYTWVHLEEAKYIPQAAKYVYHESRNFLLMCPEHRKAFNEYSFFIRFVPQERIFLFINFSGSSDGAQYHGKAINLSIDDRHAPFPALFLVHERRVRAIWPFVNEPDDFPTTIQFQDWMTVNNSVMCETRKS